MKDIELKFSIKWNSLSDKEKWKLLFKEHNNLKLSVFMDYDCINVVNEAETMYLEFNEDTGCLSAVEILLEEKGIKAIYA